MKLTTLLTAFVAFLLLASCGKATTESETKRWEASQETINTLSAQYPGFKPALKEALDAAKLKWEAATKVSGEEQQIEAMRTANKTARPQFVNQLDDMSDKMETLKDLVTDATQAGGTDHADNQALATARREADISLGNAEKALKTGSVATIDAANAIVGKVSDELESATKRIKKVMETAKGKKSEAKAAAKSEEEKAAATEAAKVDAQKSIKCDYCGTMNAHDALECSNCAAPVEKK
jgi:chromosome segregation ATPase